MSLSVYDFHCFLGAGVVSADASLMLCETALNICSYARIERTVLALHYVYEVHMVGNPTSKIIARRHISVTLLYQHVDADRPAPSYKRSYRADEKKRRH